MASGARFSAMKDALDSIEKKLFLEGLFLKYGYDFRDYSPDSLERRLVRILLECKERSLLSLLEKLLQSEAFFRTLLPSLTINTSSFFRDLDFFKSIKDQCFPILESYPSIKVWIAGCSTGEEIISLAILLKEAGLYDRTTIYATDINHKVIEFAQKGVYGQQKIKQFVKSYNEISAEKYSSDYFTYDDHNEGAKFSPELLKNVIFMEHNLTSETMFEKMHLILCRNVLIYFKKELQNHVLDTFAYSLVPGGVLGIGSKESLTFYPSSKCFNKLAERENIFQLRTNFLHVEGGYRA